MQRIAHPKPTKQTLHTALQAHTSFWSLTQKGIGLLCLRPPRFVSPVPTEQVSLVLSDHGAEDHHAHDQEDQEEDDGDYQDWHTSPLLPVWNAIASTAVIAVTGACEAGRRLPYLARRNAVRRDHYAGVEVYELRSRQGR